MAGVSCTPRDEPPSCMSRWSLGTGGDRAQIRSFGRSARFGGQRRFDVGSTRWIVLCTKCYAARSGRSTGAVVAELLRGIGPTADVVGPLQAVQDSGDTAGGEAEQPGQVSRGQRPLPSSPSAELGLRCRPASRYRSVHLWLQRRRPSRSGRILHYPAPRTFHYPAPRTFHYPAPRTRHDLAWFAQRRPGDGPQAGPFSLGAVAGDQRAVPLRLGSRRCHRRHRPIRRAA